MRRVKQDERIPAGMATALIIDCNTGQMYWSEETKLLIRPDQASVQSFQRAIKADGTLMVYCAICFGLQAVPLDEAKIASIFNLLVSVIDGDSFAGFSCFHSRSTSCYQMTQNKAISEVVRTCDFGWGVFKKKNVVTGQVSETPVLLRRTTDSLWVRSPETSAWVRARFQIDESGESSKKDKSFGLVNVHDKWLLSRAIKNGRMALANERGQTIFYRLERSPEGGFVALIDPWIVDLPGIYVGARTGGSRENHAFIKVKRVPGHDVSNEMIVVPEHGVDVMMQTVVSRNRIVYASGLHSNG